MYITIENIAYKLPCHINNVIDNRQQTKVKLYCKPNYIMDYWNKQDQRFNHYHILYHGVLILSGTHNKKEIFLVAAISIKYVSEM